MSLQSVRNAFELIAGHEEASDFEGPKAAGLIEQAESVLGLSFPPSYRLFLSQLGCGDIGGEEFFGLINSDFENSGPPDSVGITLRARKEWGLPDSMVVVYFDGAVSYYVLQTDSRESSVEGPVLSWTPGKSSSEDQLEVVWDSFGSFFESKVTQAVARL